MVGPYEYATEVVLTATFYWDLNNTTASILQGTLEAGFNTVSTGFANSLYLSQLMPASTDTRANVATEATYSLAAGVTTTYYLLAAGTTGALLPKFTVSSVTLKAEVIKK